MRLLGLIPARGGSKEIPKKNIRSLGNRPLIAWTIEAAQKAVSVDRVVVSTDDPEIAEVARDLGAEVPFIRPSEFAQDDTPGVAPVRHALDQLPEFDWVVLLQPTSPFRVAADIDGIVDFCTSRGADSAVSVVEAGHHPAWCVVMDERFRISPFLEVSPATRRQDLVPSYALNGALYLSSRSSLKASGRLVHQQTLGYKMPVLRSVDLDDDLDWAWAEFLIQGNLVA